MLYVGRDLGFAIEDDDEIAQAEEFIAKRNLPIREGMPELPHSGQSLARRSRRHTLPFP